MIGKAKDVDDVGRLRCCLSSVWTWLKNYCKAILVVDQLDDSGRQFDQIDDGVGDD